LITSVHHVWDDIYYASMGSLLQIRDVPDRVRRRLKARAAERGQSLNAFLLDLFDQEVARPTRAEVLQRAAERAERATASAVTALAEAREVVAGACAKALNHPGWTWESAATAWNFAASEAKPKSEDAA